MLNNFLGLVQNGYNREVSNRSRSKKSCGHINNYARYAKQYDDRESEKDFKRELELAEASRPIINITFDSANMNNEPKIIRLSEEDLDLLAEKIVNNVEKAL